MDMGVEDAMRCRFLIKFKEIFGIAGNWLKKNQKIGLKNSSKTT